MTNFPEFYHEYTKKKWQRKTFDFKKSVATERFLKALKYLSWIKNRLRFDLTVYIRLIITESKMYKNYKERKISDENYYKKNYKLNTSAF